MVLRYDRDALREEFRSAKPFPHVVIDPFLDPEFALEVAQSYPSFDEAQRLGKGFNAVNERRKIQVTDASLFPPAVKRLNDAIASPEFLADLVYITGIDRLLADEELAGGGMHLTDSGGHLDVHVDFNYVEERQLHRRLNILIYLNPEWDASWGGGVELWDADVKRCHRRVVPALGRCLIFQTSEISYHGVEPVRSPPGALRRSFAAYYYTREAPAAWDGTTHSTVFRARPNERLKGRVLMPLEAAARDAIPALKKTVKRIIGRS